MAEEKKIIRLADVGELEADLKKDLAEEEAKGKAADVLYCESIGDELSDLGNLPTIDPKTLRPVAHWEEIPGSYEDCSRNAFKVCSRKLQDEHLDGINKLLDTKFTRDDMELIYTYLGNGIQHDLCLRFVTSGYDLEVLREYDKKQEAGSNGKT